MKLTIPLTDSQRDSLGFAYGYSKTIVDPLTGDPKPNPQLADDFVADVVLNFINQTVASQVSKPIIDQAVVDAKIASDSEKVPKEDVVIDSTVVPGK